MLSAKLAVLMPLLGSMVSGLALRGMDKAAQIFTSFCIFVCFLASLYIFHDVFVSKVILNEFLINWVDVEGFRFDWGIKIDQITAVMLVVVSSVSFLVHIYSIGYMHEDDSIPRFMSYLSLFTFAMMMLVTSNNLVQLFFGWEGVGACSYLLIGFWYKKPSAYNAAMKAFIVNRVADFSFLIGISALYLVCSSLNFEDIFKSVDQIAAYKIMILGSEFKMVDFICLTLFIGSMGKSAQILFHTWLPDAMEGPTPVSALIHAATMVTAGVFLVVRMSPIFELSESIRMMILVVGAITALFASTIALTQTDIKKIIAYSTCSQLGYMFVACGLSAYNAAIFHLATHAFFKALLFLGAGSVIHAMHHEQDINNMGGLYKKIPITYAMFWIGSLAIAGVPPLAGYYSKDAILELAYVSNSIFGITIYMMILMAAFFTAFYSWRLIFKVFHGHAHDEHHLESAHESPKVMLIPLFALAFGALFSGYYGASVMNVLDHSLSIWGDSIFINTSNNLLEKMHHEVPFMIKILPNILTIFAIGAAYTMYIKYTNLPLILESKLGILYRLSFNKYYFDELYDKLFIQNFIKLSDMMHKIIDVKIIDGLIPNGFANISNGASRTISKYHTGYIYHYVIMVLMAILFIATWYIWATM